MAMAKAPAKKAVPAGPTQLSRDFQIAPDGMRWGLSFQLLAKVYDDAFDVEYAPVLKNTDPGREMEMLEAEIADKKTLIRRSKVEFGSQPTGVDSSPLAGEYGYNNGESMAKIPLKGGTTRNFFFYADRLWKVYDEYKLGKGMKLGSSWEEAVKALTELFGGPPQLLEPGEGRSFQEAVWLTATMQIRAIDRSHQNVVAVAFADRGVSEKIASGRKANKVANPTAMDAKVRDVTQPDEKVMKLKTGPSKAEESGKKK
jgi:hypothetical protein